MAILKYVTIITVYIDKLITLGVIHQTSQHEAQEIRVEAGKCDLENWC
jgi:hypothetical protein